MYNRWIYYHKAQEWTMYEHLTQEEIFELLCYEIKDLAADPKYDFKWEEENAPQPA